MRIAVYFAPSAESALWQTGCAWLGRDALRNEALQPLLHGRLPQAEIEPVISSPRRYGFHATLKAPFHLRSPYTFSDVISAFHGFATRQSPFFMRLKLAELSGFLALVPDGPTEQIQALAAATLADFDPFWAPVDVKAQMKKRKGLSIREQELLGRWGYPFVLERFRFHMTLTNNIGHDGVEHIMPLAAEFFTPILREPIAIDRIALFIEHEPQGDFEVHTSLPLTGEHPETALPVHQRIDWPKVHAYDSR